MRAQQSTVKVSLPSLFQRKINSGSEYQFTNLSGEGGGGDGVGVGVFFCC